MRIPHRSIVTGAATLVVLASAASLALDPNRPIHEVGVERTVALGDLCGAAGCTIAYKTDEDGAPSRVVPAR
jgi:hypothetical protein